MSNEIVQAISSDLKLTNIIGIAFGFAGLVLGVYELFAMWPVWGGAAIASGVVISGVGGVTGMVVVFLGANAAMGGAYVNAAASLSGATVTAGPTSPPIPVNQTATQQTVGAITQQDIQNLTNTIDELKTAVSQINKPASA
jgi:hypothetical protein